MRDWPLISTARKLDRKSNEQSHACVDHVGNVYCIEEALHWISNRVTTVYIWPRDLEAKQNFFNFISAQTLSIVNSLRHPRLSIL